MRNSTWIAVLLATIIGCNGADSSRPSATQPPPAPAPAPASAPAPAAGPEIKISALENDTILVDGVSESLEALDARLGEIAKAKGSVKYYRENSSAPEPPPSAMKAMDLVAKHRLPISFSRRPDFSDTVRFGPPAL